MQILYIFWEFYLNLVFPDVTICDTPSDCCKNFYVSV